MKTRGNRRRSAPKDFPHPAPQPITHRRRSQAFWSQKGDLTLGGSLNGKNAQQHRPMIQAAATPTNIVKNGTLAQNA